MDKTYEVLLNNDEDYSLISKLLKLDEHIINESLDKKSYEVKVGRFNTTIFFEKEETEEDILAKEKQIESLKQSIAKRENLLNNQGFVAKAPANLVEDEKKKLAQEKELLESLLK